MIRDSKAPWAKAFMRTLITDVFLTVKSFFLCLLFFIFIFMSYLQLNRSFYHLNKTNLSSSTLLS